MTKISTVGIEQKPLINGAQRNVEEERRTSAAKDEASVISSVKPEITEPNKAMTLAAAFLAHARVNPQQAVSAQSQLDEARVKALLGDDD